MFQRFSQMTFFVTVLCFSQMAPAVHQQHAFMRQFQTSRVAFPDENSPYAGKQTGHYPQPLKFLLENALSWTPTGEGRPLSAKCASELWGGRLQDPRARSSVPLQGALVQKYFKDCGEEIATGSNSTSINLVKMASMKFVPQEHPFLHRVVFSLPGNIKLKGLLGLKGDFKKRPLVIVRLGIFGNVEEFLPERAWLMMLFEQSPFNVLLLENMSGSDFIANNTRFAFGGYDEAIQNILIAQILKDSNEPLSRLVESLHLFGVSLGGNGVLYASLLNELNSPKGQPLYSSFMGMCPVVNLQDNMKAVIENKPFAYAVDLWSQKRLSGILKSLPALEEHESFGFLKKTVDELVRTYHGGLSYVSSVKLPPELEDGSDFWRLNDFWKYYKNVRQPVMIFASHTDLLVPFAVNSQRLQNKSMNVDSSNISVIDMKEGIHCTLPIPYDWKVVSSLLQSYILSHSPGFKLKEQSLEMELGEEGGRDFYQGPVQVRFKALPLGAKDSFVSLAIEFENEKGKTENLKLNLPLSQFDFRFFNSELSESEQDMMVRWVNQNVVMKVVDSGGKPTLRATWFVAP